MWTSISSLPCRKLEILLWPSPMSYLPPVMASLLCSCCTTGTPLQNSRRRKRRESRVETLTYFEPLCELLFWWPTLKSKLLTKGSFKLDKANEYMWAEPMWSLIQQVECRCMQNMPGRSFMSLFCMWWWVWEGLLDPDPTLLSTVNTFLLALMLVHALGCRCFTWMSNELYCSNRIY